MTDRLLMIDDDADLLEIYGRVARRCGYDVRLTSDPKTFWAHLADWRPTLILVDLRMPGCDGIEVLRGLAERQVRTQVVLSSGSDDSLLEAATRIGLERGLTMREPARKPLDPGQLRALLERLRVRGPVTAEALAAAIDAGELSLEFQPKVELRSGRPISVEALVRWNDSVGGAVATSEFLPVAEASDLIDRLTRTVIELALAQMATWRAQGLAVPVAVNVSPINLRSLDFPETLCETCARHGVDRSLLTLELTETAAHDDTTLLTDILTRLRLRDLRLSIDDFGTGHSSLMKLYRLPFSELKLDRSFVTEATSSGRAALITKSTIELAHALGMSVVAEGIEDAETGGLLTDMRCDVGQGFFYHRPLPGAMIPAVFAGSAARVA